MQQELSTNERLASVEAKLEFIQDLLKDIRNDIKNQPTRDDYLDLKSRVTILEKDYNYIKVKIYTIAAIISLVFSSMGVYIVQHIIGK